MRMELDDSRGVSVRSGVITAGESAYPTFECHNYGMRTTIELPDHLLLQAKSTAALSGMSLKDFFISAIEQKLAGTAIKTRREPPTVGSATGRPIDVLTPEQVDEAMFG